MPHIPSKLIEVRKVPGKGRGVFARKNIKKKTVIERCPIIELPVSDAFGQPEDTRIADYVFEWEKDTVALVLGYGSLYNHSYKPNAEYYDTGRSTQTFAAIKDIKAGEEITVNYNGSPKKQTPLHFDVVDE